MPTAFEAGLRHSVGFYNILLDINRDYLKGGPLLTKALFVFDLSWDNIQKSQKWAAKYMSENEIAAHVCRRIATLEILDLRQQFDERIQWLNSCFDASEFLKDEQGKADAFAKLGVVYAKKGNLDTAISNYEKALNIYMRLSDRLGESNQLGNLGLVYAAKGEVKKAIECHERSLLIAREIGDRRGEGTSLGSLGNAYYYLGDYEKALLYNQQYLDIARAIGDRQGEGDALGSIGLIYDAMGIYQLALENHNAYLAIAVEIGDQRGEATALGNLGVTLQKLVESDEALEYFFRQLTLATDIQDLRRQAGALIGIGHIYREKAAISQAINYYQRALEISKITGEDRALGTAYFYLAICQGLQGDVEGAISLGEHSLQYFDRVDGVEKSIVEENLVRWRGAFQKE
jgi:tetratricopeptide (TPR) repeat protein